MKMTLKIKNKSQRYDIIRPKPKHGPKYTKYKMCIMHTKYNDGYMY